jgi:hypothetical protein
MERDELRLLPVVQVMTTSDERRVTAMSGDYERLERRLLQATSGNFERRATSYDLVPLKQAGTRASGE